MVPKPMELRMAANVLALSLHFADLGGSGIPYQILLTPANVEE